MGIYETVSIALTCAVILSAFRVNWASTWSTSFWLALSFAALLTTALSGFMDAMGSAIVVGFGLTAWFVYRDDNPTRQRWGYVVLALISLVLGLRLLPGFHNPRLIDPQLLALDSSVFMLYANFDKAWIGAILVAFLYPLRLKPESAATSTWRASLLTVLAAGSLTILVTMGMAWTTGVVKFDPKLPHFLPLVLVIHLFFTVIPEEAFFRLLIQTPLSKRLATIQHGPRYTVLIPATLFALVHFAGGTQYMLLAFLAGIGYAYVYAKTQRLSAAITVHFSLNLVHFLFFSYPRLAVNAG